jgi:hypothetical protein
MADAKRPHLAQADLQSLRHLEMRMLIIKLCDPHTRHIASLTVVAVPSEYNGKLIIKRYVTSTETHDHKVRLWPGQHGG